MGKGGHFKNQKLIKTANAPLLGLFHFKSWGWRLEKWVSRKSDPGERRGSGKLHSVKTALKSICAMELKPIYSNYSLVESIMGLKSKWLYKPCNSNKTQMGHFVSSGLISPKFVHAPTRNWLICLFCTTFILKQRNKLDPYYFYGNKSNVTE